MKKLILWLFIIIIIGLVTAYFARNTIVAAAIEKGGTYALGVDTHLGSANLALSAASLEMNNYEIDNPSGFDSSTFLSIGRGVLDVNSGSVFADTVEIDSLVLQDIEVILEYKDGKSNYQALMDNVEKLDIESSESKTNLRIKRIIITGIKSGASISLPGNKKLVKSFDVDNIELKDVGSDGGATIANVVATIVREITKKALAEGKNILPGDFNKYFEDIGQSGLDKITSDLKEKVGNIGQSIFGGDKKKK